MITRDRENGKYWINEKIFLAVLCVNVESYGFFCLLVGLLVDALHFCTVSSIQQVPLEIQPTRVL
jgi:hypothetical protein